jgi:hypothetical protein
VAKRNRDVLAELADVLAEGADPSGDYFEKVIDATAGHDRMLLGLYSLLAVGVVSLLFLGQVSPWAGAALVTSCVLFIVGLAHASMHIATYHKMLLMADAVQHGEETVDLETGEEEATPEAFVHAEAMARRLHSSKTQYLFLGLLCAGAAAVIDHWQYAWRAFAVLGAVVVVLLLMAVVPGILRAITRRSGESSEEDAEE